MNIEEHLHAVETHGDFKILRKVKMVERFSPEPMKNPLKVFVVDTETTGTTDSDVIIECAGILIEVDPETGRIGELLEVFHGLEDTDIEIDPGAIRVHGITKEVLKGKTMDRAHFVGLYNAADMVLAHNSKFDRPLIDRFFANDGILINKPWGCSYKDIDWLERGFLKSGLEYLVPLNGYFHGAHRATDDVLALIYCLAANHPERGYPMKEVLANYQQADYMIKTLGTFDFKEALKSRGYFYTGDDKSWSIIINPEVGQTSQDAVKQEMRLLRDETLINAYGQLQGRVFFGKREAGLKHSAADYTFTEIDLKTARID